jgi:hypothetical protein
LGVTLLVLVTNAAAFGIWPRGLDWLVFVGTVFGISVLIAIGSTWPGRNSPP